MSKYPAKPKQYEDRRKRMLEGGPLSRITPLFTMQAKLLLSAYYGSQTKAAIAMLRESFMLWRHSKYLRSLLWICDTIGWTKVYWYPETRDMIGHHQRHGRKCSGSPNCANNHCISDGIPKWFRVITRWDKI